MRTTSVVRRALAVVGASLAMLLIGATAAWAPKTLNVPVVDGPCRSAGQTGYLLGQLEPTRFTPAGGGIALLGEMNATCDLPTDDVTLIGTRARSMVEVVSADCRLLVLHLGRGQTRGVSFDLEGDPMVFESDVDDPLFCRIATIENQPRKLVRLLNEVLATTEAAPVS